MDWMPQAIREGIFTILFISGPLVALAAILGLSIGIIQAATQIQEQTLGSAVKIIGLFVALIVFGFYMFQYLRRYASENIERAFRLVPSLGTYIKPRDNFLSHQAEQEPINPRIDLEAPPPIDKASSPRITNALEGPELINQNSGRNPNATLPPPSSQQREPDLNLQNQDLNFTGEQITPQPSPLVNQNNNQTNPAPEEQQETIIDQEDSEPVIRPSPRQSNTNRTQTPAAQQEPVTERRSVTNALDRIRNSIREFNEDNTPEGANP